MTRMGYVLKVFPRVSETFVINEIRMLERLGENLCVYSLHHASAAVPHRILRELQSPTYYVEDSVPVEEEVQRARRRLQLHFAVEGELETRVFPRKYVRLAVSFAKMLQAHGIVHLHAHFASRAGHVAALAAALAGCSYSVTAHAKDIYHHEVDRELLRWKLLQAKFVVTVTEYNRRHLQALLADLPHTAEKLVCIHNGVDLERFCPAEGRNAWSRFLGIGRLVEKKGFAILVEACRLLRTRGYEFSCELIGGGPEEEELRRQIAAAALQETISVVGVLPTEEVALALQTATAVVLPCIVASDGNIDALPTVLLEAAAAALPVISTKLSGIPEIVVDGETGLLVEPGDAAALADAMASLLDHPERARSMGFAGRQRAQRLFDLRSNVTRLQHLLHSVKPPRVEKVPAP